ncbi:MAG TPA: nucleoside monophosphate kinase [Candidatus Saccharimonadales bacterium]|nr:nucleoside monophosphate kinase [Candidatus Saccharimonadales bacterium]
MKKIITFYGQPGCGKSTQAQILAEKYGFSEFGMGKRLRAEINSGSDLGQQIKPYVEAGTLIPDELMIEIIKNIGQKSGPAGIIFDGFPRILSQAKMLAKIASELNWEIGNFFYLRLQPEQALKRITARAKLSNRDDDVSPEAIHNRFTIFERESAPLLDYYRTTDKLIEIDAALNIESVQAEIKKNL